MDLLQIRNKHINKAIIDSLRLQHTMARVNSEAIGQQLAEMERAHWLNLVCVSIRYVFT